jgi:creatinine amidohydrolase
MAMSIFMPEMIYIPLEVAKRAARDLDALVAPPIGFGLAPDQRGASGLVYLRLETFINPVRDVCVTLSEAGFRKIVLLNGHYVNSWALQYAVANVYDELPADVRIYPFPYWQGLKPEQAEQYLSGSAGIHANVGETSAVLAINPDLCDMDRVRDFVPELGGLRKSPFALLDPMFLATPGSLWSLLEESGGVWGTPSASTAERGEEFLEWAKTAVVDRVRKMDDVRDRLGLRR